MFGDECARRTLLFVTRLRCISKYFFLDDDVD
jgi:hypothetical protein